MLGTKQHTLYIDCETFSACELKDTGADVYAQHPSTGVWCLAYCINDEAMQLWVYGEKCPLDILLALEDNYRIVAHNVAFEWTIWKHVFEKKYGWPELKIENCDCTMVRAYVMSLPGSLDGASKSLQLKHEKDTKANRVMLQLAKPKNDGTFHNPKDDAEKFKILYDYCAQDVEVERALDKVLLPLSENARKLWLIDHRINQRGVKVDMKSLKTALQIVEFEQVRLRDELQTITSNQVATPNSHVQFKKWLSVRGIQTESIDKEAVLEMLSDPKIPSDVKRALSIRQEVSKSSTAKFNTMINGACEDNNRMKSLFQYHGANTGRWAGRRAQLQNLPRPSLGQKEINEIFDIIGEVR